MNLACNVERTRMRPREDLITRMRETTKNWDHIVNCEHHNKLWGL